MEPASPGPLAKIFRLFDRAGQFYDIIVKIGGAGALVVSAWAVGKTPVPGYTLPLSWAVILAVAYTLHRVAIRRKLGPARAFTRPHDGVVWRGLATIGAFSFWEVSQLRPYCAQCDRELHEISQRSPPCFYCNFCAADVPATGGILAARDDFRRTFEADLRRDGRRLLTQ